MYFTTGQNSCPTGQNTCNGACSGTMLPLFAHRSEITWVDGAIPVPFAIANMVQGADPND